MNRGFLLLGGGGRVQPICSLTGEPTAWRTSASLVSAAEDQTYVRLGVPGHDSEGQPHTAYLTFDAVEALASSGQLYRAARGMVLELVPPDCRVAPSLEAGQTQVWWSPYRNAFYTSKLEGQPDLKSVTKVEAQAVRPGVPLDCQLTTGVLYFDGRGNTEAELSVSDWRSPHFSRVVKSALGIKEGDGATYELFLQRGAADAIPEGDAPPQGLAIIS